MNWLVTYSRDGEVRTGMLKARFVPHISAVKFTVLAAELGQSDAPSEPTGLSNDERLEQLGIKILDVQLAPRRTRAQLVEAADKGR
ncbi:hypothetical protein IB229_00905 [Pseudomonas sp. PDM14]|uniref:hypothetical protein n=1 Tax=Pseudomonas sp. PDM14 TaxID=2769288 RepID=UPI00177C8E53|nr:hypothetical protein [Pseudomonas sp. PDM14]MBD9481516.1 hypothetical protein [Pseudomonas sp. PDM14]